MYDMPSGRTSQHVYATVQLGASAPAVATDAAQPPRSSVHNDITLIDNDLYEKPSDTVEMGQHPTTVSNVPAPPGYAMVHSAPAGNTADNGGVQPSAPPARPSLYQDITLIDNDLYE